MKTTLEGLWAIGDTSYNGSAMSGAVVSPNGGMCGSGLGNAIFSGIKGAPFAARYIKEAKAPVIKYSEVKQLKEKIFEPMGRGKGITASDAIAAFTEALSPAKYYLHRNKANLETLQSRLEEVKEKLNTVYTNDFHNLCKYHEVNGMTLGPELNFTAGLLRTESRGTHFREDYPKQDDKNWLKWIVIKKDGDKKSITTEPVPISKYPLKP